jgi:uncharacterized protein with HEPN domain
MGDEVMAYIEHEAAYEAAIKGRIIGGMVKKFINEFQVAHPEVDWDYLQSEMQDTFAYDMMMKSRQYAKMTDKQLAVVISSIERHKERQANMVRTVAEREAIKAELIKAGVQAPTGRTIITGKVVSVREVEAWGGHGTTLKGLVVSEQGWKVWTTLSTIKTERPVEEVLDLCRERGWGYDKSDAELLERLETSSARETFLYRYDEIEVGDVVTFTATCEQSDTDPLFAFAKRPAKWSVIKATKEGE